MANSDDGFDSTTKFCTECRTNRPISMFRGKQKKMVKHCAVCRSNQDASRRHELARVENLRQSLQSIASQPPAPSRSPSLPQQPPVTPKRSQAVAAITPNRPREAPYHPATPPGPQASHIELGTPLMNVPLRLSAKKTPSQPSAAASTSPSPPIAAVPSPLRRRDQIRGRVASVAAATTKLFRRGQHSGDSPPTAQARKEQIDIQRRHRVERRGGGEVCLTPTLAELRARPSSSLSQLTATQSDHLQRTSSRQLNQLSGGYYGQSSNISFPQSSQSSMRSSQHSDNDINNAEVALFDEAIRIFPTNKLVNNYNLDHMVALQQPCYQVVAKNTGQGAETVAASDAGNLHNKLPLCMGARVMLTENIWTPAGLVNGALGTVRDIAWAAGANWREEAPNVIAVEFDSYEGPAMCPEGFSIDGAPEGINYANVVPIFQSVRDFTKGRIICTRTQFPLTIAYAITVHKSQGMTVARAVLDISAQDFQPGLSYVAVSRVKTLQGLLFDVPFDLSALRQVSRDSFTAREQDGRRRQPQQVPLPVVGGVR